MSRVRLESGFKLDLPKLTRQGFLLPGSKTGPTFIRWSYTATGEEIATGLLSADLSGQFEGWARLQLGELDQRIELRARPRHFGGRQWYFRCPYKGRDVSVLWKPPGAKDFACRQRWGQQVAYGSQFERWHDRALNGAHRIRAQLDPKGIYGCIDDMFPPKPKWMRWRTYDRLAAKGEAYEAECNAYLVEIMGRLLKMG